MLEDNQKQICYSENINILNYTDYTENLDQKIIDEVDFLNKNKTIQSNLNLIHEL